MLLSGLEIEKRLNKSIIIEPYNKNQLNPNSYNLRLHEKLLVYTDEELDMSKQNATKEITIPPAGLVLEPGILYLGRTIEYTETYDLIPMLEGRSSTGRLGIATHVTAGFGDIGFKGYWTLELFCIQPVRIFAGVEICQISYHPIIGDYKTYENGKYQNNQGIQSSLLYKEFDREKECNR